MNNKTINFMIFVLGAAVGSVVTWKYVEKKYERIAQDEINSVKEVFSKRISEYFTEVRTDSNGKLVEEEVQIKADNAKEKPNIIEYAARLRKQGYINYSDMVDEKPEEVKEEEESMSVDKPYVIAPEEFGELDDYDTISLTYYADQILADDNDEIVEDIEDVVGFDSLNSFGEYEDDSVFVRNDRLKCDYEILLDQRKYSDVIRRKLQNRKPHEVDD